MFKANSFVLFLLPLFLTPVEEGVLELRVTDVTGKLLRNIGITCGEHCGTAYSDDAGRARLKLPPEKRSDDWVFLQTLKSTGGQDWVVISPWDYRLNVPSFANRPDNVAVVTVARKGDRQLLSSGKAVETLTARILKQLKAKLEREVSDEERVLALKEQAESFGLTPQEVNVAIREWGRKAEDPYQQGLAALYEKNYPKATELLTKSYEIRKAAKETSENEFVDVAVFLGETHYARGEFREAVAKLREASAERPTDGTILTSLAMALLGAEELDEAERTGRRAVSAKMADSGFGPRSPQLAGAQYELARLDFRQRKFNEAEALLKEALEINEQELGPEDESVEKCLRSLAEVYQAMDRNDEAAKVLLRANEIKNKLSRDRRERDLAEAKAELASKEKELGAENPALEPSVRRLAFAHFYANQFVEAEPLFVRALAWQEKANGREHPSIAVSVMDVARVYHSLKKYSEAEAAWKRSLTILEKVVEPNHYRLLKPLQGYWLTLRDMGRDVDAKAVEERIKAIERKYPGYGNAGKKAA
ncbi:MAG TPA: tetratricopeptide repeat protein [Blastocatellia bacterium]|jgi:tetratricopeptide (TPR) repeat protein|nr:tetratricopeptide repeat protein [Blastocatellia bacterium]